MKKQHCIKSPNQTGTIYQYFAGSEPRADTPKRKQAHIIFLSAKMKCFVNSSTSILHTHTVALAQNQTIRQVIILDPSLSLMHTKDICRQTHAQRRAHT